MNLLDLLKYLFPPIHTAITVLMGNKIAVLGMQGSGKTQFYKTLKKESYNSYEATAKDEISWFWFMLGNKPILIRKGTDIGGTVDYVRPYYEEMIEKNDAIFFFFDAERYLNDAQYAEDTRVRLDFLYRKLEKKYPSKSDLEARYAIMASHYDCIPKGQQKNVLAELQNSIKGKRYESLFKNNLLLCNTTNRDKLLEVLEKSKLFK